MKLLKNKEVRNTILWMMAVTLVASAMAFAWQARFGFFTLTLCILLIAIYTVSTYMRYRRISQLAADVDRILHGETDVPLDKYAEGELGILRSEIFKMTTRLRENEYRLLTDKRYLADSLADISHQLRTPLTSINLLVSLLAEPGNSLERRQSITRELSVLLGRIDWLITTLLKLSRLDAQTVKFTKTQVSLRSLIQQACEPLLIPMELRDQTLNLTASGDFYGDLAWTSEAVGNIIKNCMEHTPDGGQITVKASENALYSELIISDTGPGIDREDLPHIFERFYKGKNSDDKSFGVGLALARMIVTAQNGTIKAENTDNGAQFTLRFFKGIV